MHENPPTVRPDLVPEETLDTGCRILGQCVRQFFELPGIREDYQAWQKRRATTQSHKEEHK